jgi:hypothetical protein
VLKNSSLIPDAHNPKTSQNMQATATALEFAKLKNSDQKKKTPDREYDVDGSYLSLSLSLSPYLRAARARRFQLFISPLSAVVLCCEHGLARSRPDLRRRVRARRDARKP